MLGALFEDEPEGGTTTATWVPDARPAHGVAGLLNQGTTCYLNSLLQTMFLTHELRWGLYSLSEEELGAEILREQDAREKAEEALRAQAGDGENATTKEEEAAADAFKEDPTYDGIVEEMGQAGFPSYHVVLALRADAALLHNKQDLFMWLLDNPLPDDWEEQEKAEKAAQEATEGEDVSSGASNTSNGDSGAGSSGEAKKPKKVKYRRIPLRLRELFVRMELSDVSALSTQQLTTSFGWKENHVGGQHDVSELNRVLFDALHRSLQGTTGTQLVSSLYSGKLVNRIWCCGCNNVREREEVYFDHVLPIRSTLMQSMRDYVSPTFLTVRAGDNKYECSVCSEAGRGRQDAYMGGTLHETPPVLMLTLQRLGIDYQTGRRVKVGDRMAFPLEIDITDYETEAVAERTRQEHELRSSQDGEAIADEKPAHTAHEGGKRKNKKKNKKNKKGGDGDGAESEEPEPLIESVISDEARANGKVYELVSVIVHSGNPYGGHYYCITRDRLNRKGGLDDSADNEARSSLGGSWFCLNDSTVTPVKESSLSEEYGNGRSHHCAYMLVYVKAGSLEAAQEAPPPPKVVEEIEQENQRIRVDREAWERENAKITVSVSTLDQFSIEGDLICLPETEAQEGASPIDTGLDEDADLGVLAALSDLERLAEEEQGKEITLSNSDPANGLLCVRLDRSTKLSAFMEAVVDQLKSAPAVASMISDSVRGRLDLYKTGHERRVRLIGALTDIDVDAQWSSESTLQELGIDKGAQLMLWRGTEANLTKEMSIEVHFYCDGVTDGKIADPQILYVDAKDCTTISGLKATLAEYTGLEEGEMLLCRGDGSSMRMLKDDSETLYEASIEDSTVVTVEELVWDSEKKKRPISLAIQRHDEKENELSLNVVNEMGVGNPELVIECTKDSTVAELRVLIASMAGIDESLFALLWPNGMEIIETDRTLMSLSICGDVKLTVKLRSDIDDSMEVQFVAYLESDSTEQRQERNDIVLNVTVSANCTVGELKAACVERWTEFSGNESMAHRSYRLRRMNFMKETREILENESKSLSDVDVFAGDLVCLEEGRVPVPGEMTVQLVVYEWKDVQDAVGLITQLQDQYLEERRVQEAREVAAAADDGEADSKDPDPAAAQPMLDEAADELEVSEFSRTAPSGSNNNEDSKESGEAGSGGREATASDTATSSVEGKERVELHPVSFFSPAFFRGRRHMEWEEIPQRVFFSEPVRVYTLRTETVSDLKKSALDALRVNKSLFPNTTQSALEMDSVALRIWNGTRLLSRDQQTIKKSGIGNGATLTVEVLPGSYSMHRNATVLNILLWNGVDEKSRFTVLGEVAFVTEQATFAQLQEQLSGFCGLAAESLGAGKYFYHRKTWMKLETVMRRPSKTGEEVDESKLSNKQKAAARNLRKNMCNLSHGDVLVVFDSSAVEWSDIVKHMEHDVSVPRKYEPTEEEVQRFILESAYAAGGDDAGLRIDTEQRSDSKCEVVEWRTILHGNAPERASLFEKE